ncbi:MAG TPA: hypothetical protein ACFYD4_07590 [Candidatus Wunengus sp. YC61]|uniref:hypothetical protein n=1 Tax=Candidatus Wunengus sp. YC61 TaxID=3367698 RepID=UPI00402808DE
MIENGWAELAKEFVNLIKENEELKKENAKLRAALKDIGAFGIPERAETAPAKEDPIYILIGKNSKELDRSTDLAKIINGWHTHFGSTIRKK